MNKISNSPFTKTDLEQKWSSTSVTDWLISYKQQLIAGVVILVFSLGAVYLFISQNTVHQEQEVFQAQTLFNRYQQAQTDESRSFDYQELSKILIRYPDLQAKYAGPLAQLLLIADQPSFAADWANTVFKRTQSDSLKFYQNYGQTSLLIANQEYEKALTQSQQLKENLNSISQIDEHASLYTFNLLRLITLYQQLNQPIEEKKVVEELQNNFFYLNSFSPLFQKIKLGQVSLDQYLKEYKNF